MPVMGWSGGARTWLRAAGLAGLTLFLLLYFRLAGHSTTHAVARKAIDGVQVPGPPVGCLIQPLANLSQLRQYFNHQEAPCTFLREFGVVPPAPKSGRKLMCLDRHYGIDPKHCLVLSFGVGNTWAFEDEVAAFGCQVVAFDPTIGKEDHKRGDKIQFYNIGISNFKGTKPLGMLSSGTKKPSTVDRFENLLVRAGLNERVIDYLKMDVELSELDFLQDLLFNSPHLLGNIKQIAMEVHHVSEGEVDLGPASVYQLFWTYYQMLRCHGFRMIKTYSHNTKRGWTEVLWGRDKACAEEGRGR